MMRPDMQLGGAGGSKETAGDDDEGSDAGFGIQRMGGDAEEEEEEEYDEDGQLTGRMIPKPQRTVVGALVHGSIVNLEDEENKAKLAELI